MIRVKMLRGNETAIIDDGRVYLFGLDGKCREEGAEGLMGYAERAIDLPIISVLSCNGKTDVGVSRPGQPFKSYQVAMPGMQCVQHLSICGKFIKMLHRVGTESGESFNQMLFIYREDFDISPILVKLGIREV